MHNAECSCPLCIIELTIAKYIENKSNKRWNRDHLFRRDKTFSFMW